MRCRTLAQELASRGLRSVMVGPALQWQTEADRQLFVDWVERDWSTLEAEAVALADVADRYGSKVCVLDDYRVDETFQRVLLERGLEWMQQFNSAAPPPFLGRWVVNAGPRETEALYTGQRRSDRTRFLLGPDYAVLRPAFCNRPLRDAPLLKTVLVSLGGGDDRGVIEPLVTELLANGPAELGYRIMSGRSNPSNGALQAWVAAHDPRRLQLVIDPSDVLSEYDKSDVAIIAGGTSTFEAAAVGLPMIIIALADNQINQAMGWVERGAGYFVGNYKSFNVRDVIAHLETLTIQNELARMSRAAQSTVDGHGCSRLAEALAEAAR